MNKPVITALFLALAVLGIGGLAPAAAKSASCYAVFHFDDVYNGGNGNAARVASVGLHPAITPRGPMPLMVVQEGGQVPLGVADGGWVPSANDLIVRRGQNSFDVMLYGYHFTTMDYERTIGTITIVNGAITRIINSPTDPLDNQGNGKCSTKAGYYDDDEVWLTGSNSLKFCMGVSPGADAFTVAYTCN